MAKFRLLILLSCCANAMGIARPAKNARPLAGNFYSCKAILPIARPPMACRLRLRQTRLKSKRTSHATTLPVSPGGFWRGKMLVQTNTRPPTAASERLVLWHARPEVAAFLIKLVFSWRVGLLWERTMRVDGRILGVWLIAAGAVSGVGRRMLGLIAGINTSSIG
jgi:hypothetical protein